MSFFKRLLGGKDDGGGHEPPTMPWDQRPSILEFVRSHIARGKPWMTEDGDTLPDEDRLAQGSQIRWAAGAMDGVLTHHMGSGEADEAVSKMVRLVLAYAKRHSRGRNAAVGRRDARLSWRSGQNRWACAQPLPLS